jgi:hypothetical protein
MGSQAARAGIAMGLGSAGAPTDAPGQSGQARPDAQAGQGSQAAVSSNKVDPTNVKLVVTAAFKALYTNGLITNAMQVIRGSASVAKGLADTTYMLVQHIDQKTHGSIPSADLGPIASQVLGAIADSCMKSGIQVTGKDIAIASQSMLMRVLQQYGVDVSAMQAASSQVNWDQVGKMVDQQMAQQAGARSAMAVTMSSTDPEQSPDPTASQGQVVGATDKRGS